MSTSAFQPKKLIFVYNARSGKWNAYLDAAHKLLSPATYACKLCALTYGVWSENEKWKQFRKKTQIEMEFLHIDEWQSHYPDLSDKYNEYPFVLGLDAQQTDQLFLTSNDFKSIKTVEALMEKISALQP